MIKRSYIIAKILLIIKWLKFFNTKVLAINNKVFIIYITNIKIANIYFDFAIKLLKLISTLILFIYMKNNNF